MEEYSMTIADIHGPIWELILKWLDLQTLRDWRTLRLVSRFWNTTVSVKLSHFTCSDLLDIEKALVVDLHTVSDSLRSLALGPSLVGREVPLEEPRTPPLIHNLLHLKRLHKLRLENCESIFRASDLPLLAGNLQLLRSLALLGFKKIKWNDIFNILPNWPHLESLEVSNSIELQPTDSPATPQLLPLEFLHSFSAMNLPCLPPDLGLPCSSITYLKLRSCITHSFERCLEWLATLPCLQSLDLSRSKAESHDLKLPESPFRALTDLTWNMPPIAIQVLFLLRLPKLSRFECFPGALMAPAIDVDRPPPKSESLLEFEIGTSFHVDWTWGVLQLIPNVTRLFISDLYPSTHAPTNQTPIRDVLNSLEHLTALELPMLGYPADSLLSKKSFAARLRALDLSWYRMPAMNVQRWVGSSPHLTKLRLSGNHRVLSKDLECLVTLPLRDLNVSNCLGLGTDALKVIAQISTLEVLDLSYLSNIWTTHLRILEPLTKLRRLAHVVSYRQIASFENLKGLWPHLSTLRLEKSLSRSFLVECFGPLVHLDLV